MPEKMTDLHARVEEVLIGIAPCGDPLCKYCLLRELLAENKALREERDREHKRAEMWATAAERHHMFCEIAEAELAQLREITRKYYVSHGNKPFTADDCRCDRCERYRALPAPPEVEENKS